jgi:hypothetical protein
MTLSSRVADLTAGIAAYIKNNIKPRLTPPGGAVGTLLTKTANGDYAYGWTTPGWVLRTGDSMAGGLNLVYANPTLVLKQVGGANDGNAFSFLNFATDNRLYTQYTPKGGSAINPLSLGSDGSLATLQLGDLNARIEARGAAYQAAAQAASLPLLGGTLTGNLSVSKTGDAEVRIESLDAPATSYRLKRIFSSNNVGAGDDWLFRATRPSDGAVQDWLLKSGSGGTIWTSGNITPVRAGGDTMSGGLGITMNGPNVMLKQAGGTYDQYGWNLYHYQTDGSLYFQDYRSGAFQANSFRFDRSGALVTAQFGDLNARIEARGLAYQQAAQATSVQKTGDQTMAGNITVNKAYPAINLYYPGTLAGSWIIDSDARMKFRNTDNGDIYISVGVAGDVSTKQFGDLNSRIEARGLAYQQAAQSTSVQKTGDHVMAGWLTAAGFTATGAGNGYNVNSRDGNTAILIYNTTNRIRFYNGSGDVFSVGTDGSATFSQFGDLNSRIEARGLAYQQAAQNTSVQKTGSTMTGALYIDYNYPQIQLTNRDGNGFPYIDFCHAPYGHADFTYRLRHSSGDNSMYFDYVDNGVRLAIRTDGSLYIAQFGDVNARIEARGAAFADDRRNSSVVSARWVYSGDLTSAWNINGGFGNPYGGASCLVDRATFNEADGTWNISTFRWRNLQILVPYSGWVATGAAS